MAGDFNKPVVADAYASVLQYVRDLAKDLALCLDNTGTQNIPTNAIRWSSANNRFEKYNGSAWAALTGQYAIDVATVGGKSVGNASGNVPLSNGTVNTNLNADMVDGFHASQSIVANNVVVRDANGYITTGYINSTADVTPTTPSHFAVQTSSDNYMRWRTLANIKSDLGIGAGANNIGAPGTWGAVTLQNNVNSWAGFRFGTGLGSDNRYFMTNGGTTGEYDASAGWQWRFDNGTLAVGTVPWARLSGVPSFPYYPNTGGNLSGYIAVANEGASPDPYGAISVTKPAVSDTPSYFSMTRAGQSVVQMGMDSSNRFVMGGGTSGTSGRITSNWLLVNGSGQLWTANYGWLHDYFFSTVANCAAGYGMGTTVVSNCGNIQATRTELVDNGGQILLRTNQWNYNCNCNCDCSC